MKSNDSRILRQRKRKLARRLDGRRAKQRREPMLTATNVQYEMADRTRAIDCAGIGAFHTLAGRTGLVGEIDRHVQVLKRHLPYHESDHVLNIAYNTLTGGACLDDIERRRQDEVYMDALGAERIPDPTTAGDFARRFARSDVVALMDAVNRVRVPLWRRGLSRAERSRAVLEADGTMAPTTGECKEGMELSYTGVWGYHPLIVSLANTQEPLYIVNRPGNRPSHEGAAQWIDRGIALVREVFDEVYLRGDTDFSLTGDFDRWHEGGVHFAFGYDAMPNLVEKVEALPQTSWAPLKRRRKARGNAPERRRPRNVKQAIVQERGFESLHLEGEEVAEFAYRPGKCARHYRVVVVRKDISCSSGQKMLWRDYRYFFYITNITHWKAWEIVRFCNERCNQENLLGQLKNGLNALRMPVGDLVSNWAYMVMASLAWTLKAWFALQARRKCDRDQLLMMEFRTFLNSIMLVPCQIVRGARRLVFRLLNWNHWTSRFLEIFQDIRSLRLT